MTSLTIGFTEERIKRHRELVGRFIPWCQKHGKIRLSEWLDVHHGATQDLYLAGLIDYISPDFLPVSMSFFEEPFLTPAGSFVIGACVEGDGKAVPSLCYVIDSDLLLELLHPFLTRSSSERERGYLTEYKARHGHAPLSSYIGLSKL